MSGLRPADALSAAVAEAVRAACLAELAALKPGNVHVYADGHDMCVEDFRRSAAVAAKALARPGLGVGARIEAAVEATMNAIGVNTNLGIILLSAPLAQAALEGAAGAGLKAGVGHVLDRLDVSDTVLAYRAIRRAAPAGLGESARHDVRSAPTVGLREAMAEAQGRDAIARQYANGFEDVFGFGVLRLRETLARWGAVEWATTSAYLGYLGRFADSHIVRKFGDGPAKQVRSRAGALDAELLRRESPEEMTEELLEFDAELKARGLNPGTSADLTVASLLAVGLQELAEAPPTDG